MPTVGQILGTLEEIAPARFAFEFDKVGLQIGDRGREVTKAVVSLDRSLSAIRFAKSLGAQLLLSHHPLIWDPLTSLTGRDIAELGAAELIRSDMAFIAAHTNWDCAQGGINDTLAGLLDLKDIRSIGSAAPVQQLKLVVFCPLEDCERVIDAASTAGAGVIGCYSRCAFRSKGTGTFVGSEASNPSIGKAGQQEEVEELRIEMVLPTVKRPQVEAAIRKHHPYEEPAIDFYSLAPLSEQPICRIGDLPNRVSLTDFAASVDKNLATRCWTFGDPSKPISKVAICGGAADDEWIHAKSSGADVFVTGEVKQHVGMEAAERSFAIIAAGHYATEHPGCVALAARMRESVPEVEWQVFTPEPGAAGRPF
ncbi:MAG TPA: Nif3-like dinuclear metal center hexameric protein [Fimbriimonadaceae bacterium]|jgi:dinuclear metal center YbgI/SA1388 family protein